jgi:hypothetical protein
MKPEAARALPPQDNQLMSQGDGSRSSDARLRNRNESMETKADRMVIMPPDRTAITRKNPQAFPTVHSVE